MRALRSITRVRRWRPRNGSVDFLGSARGCGCQSVRNTQSGGEIPWAGAFRPQSSQGSRDGEPGRDSVPAPRYVINSTVACPVRAGMATSVLAESKPITGLG